jgi:hypothetical protein
VFEYYKIKDVINGIKYLHLYYNCDKKDAVEGDLKYKINNILDIADSIEDKNGFFNTLQAFDRIESVFRYYLDDNYPNNKRGLYRTIAKCFKSVKEHYSQVLGSGVVNDKSVVIPKIIMDAVYGMAYVYEKLLRNIKENDTLQIGEKRFADTFMQDYFTGVYSNDPDYLLGKITSYKFDDLLKYLKSDYHGEDEAFTEDELKEFLMSFPESVFGVNLTIDGCKNRRRTIKPLIRYANKNLSSEEFVTTKDLIRPKKGSLLFRPEKGLEESVKLLSGSTLEEAYNGEAEDEPTYEYYLKALEMKNLFADVRVDGVNSKSINSLIKNYPGVCNAVRVSVLQNVLDEFVECLFDAFGLDDGNVYYLNDKINKLAKIGVDVKMLLHVDNLPTLLDRVTVSKIIRGDRSFWFNFTENIKKLKDYYFPSDIVYLIKHHPEIVFADYNVLCKFEKDYGLYNLFVNGQISDGLQL